MQEKENHPKPGSVVKLILMTDIHMTNKPGRLAFPLRKFCDCDALLLTGDLVNDGLSEQYERVKQALEQNTGYPLFAVAGNHDYPAEPEQDEDSWDWSAFQEWFLARDRDYGMAATQHESGSYAVRMGTLEIIGLNCTAGYHKFGFAGTNALDWLDAHLKETGDHIWHILLCHAPLISHNPQRKATDEPYFRRDKYLQDIVNRHGKILFLSGHTHISPCSDGGCLDIDWERNNLYYNGGSVCRTTLKTTCPHPPDNWTDGIYTEILVGRKEISFAAKSVKTGEQLIGGKYCAEEARQKTENDRQDNPHAERSEPHNG